MSGPGVPHGPSDEGTRPSDNVFPALGNRHPSSRKKPPGDGKRSTRPSVKRYPITGKRGDRPSDKGCPSLANGGPFPPWSGNPGLGQRVPDRSNGVPRCLGKGPPVPGEGYPTPGKGQPELREEASPKRVNGLSVPRLMATRPTRKGLYTVPRKPWDPSPNLRARPLDKVSLPRQ